MPRHLQCAAKQLTDKATAAGFNGVQVDGNNFSAVVTTVAAAIARARTGKGPGLVECLSDRLSDHSTADDASRYRQKSELEQAREQDPLSLLSDQLRARGE